MQTYKTKQHLAAFRLGFSLNNLKDVLLDHSNNTISLEIFGKSMEQLITYKKSYSALFNENLNIPFEYISEKQLREYFTSLFEITEEKIYSHYNECLHIYFYAGGIVYLSDITNVVLEKEKFKFIFYQILCELGLNISWNEVDLIAAQLTCENQSSRRNGKKQLLELVLNNNIQCNN